MKYLLSVMAFLFAVAGFSQSKISGQITNSNNEKLSGVLVHIEENNAETTTDANGFYQFTTLPKGTNKLIFFLSGYEILTKKVNHLETDAVVNVILEEKENTNGKIEFLGGEENTHIEFSDIYF